MNVSRPDSLFRQSVASLLTALLMSLMAAPVTAQQSDATVRLLAELVNADGASGFEGPVRDILKREWAPLVSELRTDGMGNLLGSLAGQSESPRVLLMAH